MMMKKLIFKVFIIASCVLFSFSGKDLLGREDLMVNSINIPEALKEIYLAKHFILEDINKDGLEDIIFLYKKKIFISYQKNDGAFNNFEIIPIPINGALDFGDVFPGKNKEILIMHKDGISVVIREDKEWKLNPELLIEKATIYSSIDCDFLQKERFVLHLDTDDIPELVVWGKNFIHFYYRGESQSYQLIQSLPIEFHEYTSYPGLEIYHSPLGWMFGSGTTGIFEEIWPIEVRYFSYSTRITSNRFLIKDFNRDSRKDFIRIFPKGVRNQRKKNSSFYEYRVFLLGENRKYSESPDRIIHDPHGVLLNPHCIDINSNGHFDLLRYEIKSEENITGSSKKEFTLHLANEKGEYEEVPSQVLYTSDYPFGDRMLFDVDGDKKLDLALIHPITKGFSIGSVIRKFVEKGVKIEIRILPFRENKCFSKDEIIRKKVEMKYMTGIPLNPLNLSGDFNGDGKRDLLLVDGHKIEIYPFISLKKGFTSKPKFQKKIGMINGYRVADVNHDLKSELILFTSEKIKVVSWSNSLLNQKP